MNLSGTNNRNTAHATRTNENAGATKRNYFMPVTGDSMTQSFSPCAAESFNAEFVSIPPTKRFNAD